MARPGYVKKKDDNYWNAVTWIKAYPEYTQMARENLAARDKGYDDDGIKGLMAAMCLQACEDYRTATTKYTKNTKIGKETQKDCEKFFSGDIFQYFVNGMSVKDIKRMIKKSKKKFRVADSQKIQGLL